MHPLARLHQAQGRKSTSVVTTAGRVRVEEFGAVNYFGRLSDEPVKKDDGTLVCECTSSKVMYGVGGLVIGAAAVWLLNDSQKASIQSKARSQGGKALARGKVAMSKAAFVAREQVFKNKQRYWDKRGTDAIARGDERGAKVAADNYDKVSLQKRAFYEANGITD